MLNKLNQIEAAFQNLLNGNTDAGSNVFINRMDVANADDGEDKYIFVYFTGDTTDAHEYRSADYVLKANFAFECLVTQKNSDAILADARALAHQLQQILINNSDGGMDYFDLRYTGSQLIKDAERSVPLVGYKLNFELTYLSGIL